MKSKISLSSIKLLFQRSATDLIKHEGIEHAGYLSFLSILSFFPFVIFFIAIAGLLGRLDVGERLLSFTLENLPINISNVLSPRINEIISGPPQSLLTIAIIGVIWTASSMVEGLKTILNKAYHSSNPQIYFFRRMISILQFFLISFIIFTTVMITIVMPAIIVKINSLLLINHSFTSAFSSHTWFYVNKIIMFLILFFMISFIYFLLPNVKQNILRTAPGALITIIGWYVMAKLFAIYLKNFNQVNMIYGSLKGIIISLIFFYLINLTLIFGAEFNYHFEKLLGHNIREKYKSKK